MHPCNRQAAIGMSTTSMYRFNCCEHRSCAINCRAWSHSELGADGLSCSPRKSLICLDDQSFSPLLRAQSGTKTSVPRRFWAGRTSFLLANQTTVHSALRREHMVQASGGLFPCIATSRGRSHALLATRHGSQEWFCRRIRPVLSLGRWEFLPGVVNYP